VERIVLTRPIVAELDGGKVKINVRAAVIEAADKVVADAVIQTAIADGVAELYLLDREFVLEAVREKIVRENGPLRRCGASSPGVGAEENGEEEPRPEGKWEPQEGLDGEEFWRCSNCGDDFWFEYNPTEPPFAVNYCSSCGARMEE